MDVSIAAEERRYVGMKEDDSKIEGQRALARPEEKMSGKEWERPWCKVRPCLLNGWSLNQLGAEIR